MLEEQNDEWAVGRLVFAQDVFPDSTTMNDWLKYQEVTFPGSDVQVPKKFFRYSAADRLVRTHVLGHGELVRFGNDGPFGGMYFDSTTNAVFNCVERPMTEPRLVNSTLRQFRETVKAVLAMFPLYGREAELEERETVASTVAGVIARIDADAMTVDTFWATFVDDLVIGDFATEDILRTDTPS